MDQNILLIRGAAGDVSVARCPLQQGSARRSPGLCGLFLCSHPCCEAKVQDLGATWGLGPMCAQPDGEELGFLGVWGAPLCPMGPSHGRFAEELGGPSRRASPEIN